MPEHFCTSLILPKNKQQPRHLKKIFADVFNLHEGRHIVGVSKWTIFTNKEIVFGVYEYENSDFDDICVSIPEYVFHKATFEQELQEFNSFIEACFCICPSIKYALCSYELNSLFLGKKHHLKDFDTAFLAQFPIVYTRQPGTNKPLLTLHLQAQDIFLEPEFSITFDRD